MACEANDFHLTTCCLGVNSIGETSKLRVVRLGVPRINNTAVGIKQNPQRSSLPSQLPSPRVGPTWATGMGPNPITKATA